MGRPVTVGGDRTVTIRLPEKLLDTIDEWASVNDASRSEAVRRLVERGLEAKAAGGRPKRKQK
jgi:metal-responsive CopG/Arc/MetJ family transcriptional regulator